MAKATLGVGMTLDGFRIEQHLHRGGMADIWRVTRPDIDFPIVMKAPFLDHDGDLSLLVGFEVEQMIMAEIKGVHVPRLVANGDFAVQPYIVMEYLAGPTLLKRMSERQLSVEAAVGYATAVADALGDLHQQRVLHLDLKPANVLFRPSGEAVIIDFGLSRHELLPDLLEEQFHKPTGTTEYMAPEQLVSIRSDKRSDLFALGAILYQMATGELPFGAPARIKHVRNRVWRDPEPPRAIRPEITPALQEVMLRCLEPMPSRRYATAEELAFDLRHLDLVAETERAGRTARAGFQETFQRWMRVRATMKEIRADAKQEPPRPPILLVAVDLSPGLEALRQVLLETAVSMLANMPGARLACLNVMQTSLIAIDENVNAAGENIHVQRIAELRQWAAPLNLPRAKVTYHLVENRSISAGIIEFARSNSVDHLVIGAAVTGGQMASRQTAQITAEAPCSVSVARVGPIRAGVERRETTEARGQAEPGA